MLFCSKSFLVFFSAVFVLYWLTPWQRARVWLLLAASFVFYATWNVQLACLIAATAAIDYVIGRVLDASANQRLRQVVFGSSLVMNLGLLCYFKYANFFLQSAEDALRAAGSTTTMPILHVLLPVGISFYTFEAINYTFDVYRRRVPAERNLGHFLLFILFFPHLIAGPIVRARDFLPQIARRKHWDWARMQLGVQYFLMGLFKKMAIADRMAQFADPVFQHPDQYRTSAVWIAVLAFAVRIYCDFSGYTDMALGCAHLLGYKLAPNFNMPYLAANFSEFWRRWHISLSGWLRDYLFIPLGGSRGSEWQTARNLILTMTLGGLWHGVSWMFVVWGLLHGVLLVAHRGFRAFCETRPRLAWLLTTPPGTVLRVAVTFAGVCLGWIFFFAASIEAETGMAMLARKAIGEAVPAQTYSAWRASGVLLHKLVVPHPGLSLEGERVVWVTLAFVLAAHAVTASGAWRRLAVRLPAPVLGMGYATALSLALLLAPGGGRAFIYFQF